ncbi:MAG TPA: metal ABC transporter permease [Candidatus Acidoferrum sp.]|jgi:zinc/manganese transport system permease protein|nr:metal ABC transporter permease [Candidatus Acidoferrum sp.]
MDEIFATITNTSPQLGWNLLDDIAALFHYDFMVHAFEAGTIVAVVAGSIGYFVVLRSSSFAAHALSHIGFAGATGAVVLGLNPIFGLLAFTLGSGIAIGALGNRLRGRDVTIGIVLAWTLGLGVLFISLYTGYATEAYALLFGEILGISSNDVVVTIVAGVVTIAALVATYRPLLFASVDEELAGAKGVPVTALSIAFMAILAVAVTEAVQVVGVLLIFALIVTPAAIAVRFTSRPSVAIGIGVVLALLFTWLGLAIAYYSPHPVSFFITSLAFFTYVGVRLSEPLRTRFGRRAAIARAAG